jgi:leader peptidase (prepilin peptidase)/N-methyltransferase
MIAVGCWGGMALPQNDPLNHFWGMVFGWGIIVGLRVLGWIMYRREAMGLGDAKLLALIGAFLGWRMLPFILLASAVQALVAIIGAQIYTRLTGQANALTVSTEELDAYFGEEEMYADVGSHIAIPYGPFLALAAFEVIVFGPTVILEQFYSFLYVA